MSQTSDLIQYSILVGCFIFTLISQSLLLTKCMKAKLNERLAPSILINMFFWCWSSIGGILYMGYRGFFAPAEWNLTLMFIIICIFLFTSTSVSASVTFLLLDRILVLSQPTKYKKWQEWFIILAFSFCIFTGSMSVIIVCFTELPLNSTKSCTSFGCVLSKNHGNFAALVRYSVNCLNLIVAVVFQWVLCSFSSVASSKRQYTRANRVTTVAFIIEFFCNFLPATVHFVCDLLQISETLVLGPYVVLLYGTDAFTTALIYRFIITSKRKSKIQTGGATVLSNSRHKSTAPVQID